MLTELGFFIFWIEALLLLFSFFFVVSQWNNSCYEFKRSALWWFTGHSFGLALIAWIAMLTGHLIK